MGLVTLLPVEHILKDPAFGTAGTGGNTWSVGRVKSGRAPSDHSRTVCVTSGLSFLGFSLVNHLIARGYTVRLLLHSQEDLEMAREMEMSGEVRREAIVCNLMDVYSLCQAFHGCGGVFHTSAFIDSTGLSGYTKHMAQLEAKVADIVVQACVRTPSVRKCVFTSSLLACVWRYRDDSSNCSIALDENSWSEEDICRDKMLWLALGKTMAEKAAWRAARGTDLKLVTICPALMTGTGFCRWNSTASIAYLKGMKEMFDNNVLALVDVGRAANAHVAVYEKLNGTGTACGRYICFDHLITRAREVEELKLHLGVPNRTPDWNACPRRTSFVLSNRKLSRLVSLPRTCSYDIYSVLYN